MNLRYLISRYLTLRDYDNPHIDPDVQAMKRDEAIKKAREAIRANLQEQFNYTLLTHYENEAKQTKLKL